MRIIAIVIILVNECRDGESKHGNNLDGQACRHFHRSFRNDDLHGASGVSITALGVLILRRAQCAAGRQPPSYGLRFTADRGNQPVAA